VCVCANPLALLTEQKTLHRETRGIFGIGGSGRLRYRGSIGVCVCLCVFIPAREICYFKSVEQKPVQEPQLQNKLTPKTPDQLLVGSSARVLHETAGKCF